MAITPHPGPELVVLRLRRLWGGDGFSCPERRLSVVLVLYLVLNGVYGKVVGGRAAGSNRHGEDVNLPSRAWHN